MDPVVSYEENKSYKILASVVYITCSLSIIGSLLIIFTYILFRDLRTNVRLMLFHLSIMDLGIGLSNLIGTAINFNKYYFHSNSDHPRKLVDDLCKSQAFFAVYSTFGSILFTNCLAVYLYFIIVYRIDQKAVVYLMRFIYVFCYLMPLLLSCWLLFTHKLGPTPYGSGGWCAIVDVDLITGDRNYFVSSFGYDMWIYLTFVLVTVLYVGSRFHINLELRKNYLGADKLWTAVHKLDYKFLLIPLAFIFLRIWTCIMTILSDYMDMNIDIHGGSNLIKAIYYLSVIGDSGQGAANGLTFVFLTKKVREKIFCNPFKKYKLKMKESDRLLNSN